MITLEDGRTRVTVAPEFGGRIAQIECHDGESWLPLLVDPPMASAEADPLSWGSYVMAPWPGRVAGARFRWEGRSYELPLNHGRHSIHGRGVFLPWQLVDADGRSCHMVLEPVDGWPFAARLEQRIEIEPDGVRQRVEIGAIEGARFPAGAGWHPWFRRAHGGSTRILVDADEYYETDGDLIPTGRRAAVSGERDLRDGPAADERRLDCCYRGVRQPARVTSRGIEVSLEWSPNVTHVVVYTPEDAVCLEPQTCAPDAFNLAARGLADTGVGIVEPGSPLVAWTSWRWRSL
jgi:galactose mutarotase-like enzyme